MAVALPLGFRDAARRHAASSDGAERRSGLAAIMMLLLALFGLLAVAALHVFAIDSEGQVALIFPANLSDTQSFQFIADAGGRPIRIGRSLLTDSKVWLAKGDTPDFVPRVRASGALFVINPYAFGGCVVRFSEQ